jgi:hypothetical protein
MPRRRIQRVRARTPLLLPEAQAEVEAEAAHSVAKCSIVLTQGLPPWHLNSPTATATAALPTAATAATATSVVECFAVRGDWSQEVVEREHAAGQ